MFKNINILISGATVGASALATKLTQQGIQYSWIRRAEPATSRGDTGLILPPDAINSLERMGLKEKISKHWQPCKEIVNYIDANVILHKTKMESLQDEVVCAGITKSSLITLLQQGAHFNNQQEGEIDKLKQNDDGVSVWFKGKSVSEKFDWVIDTEDGYPLNILMGNPVEQRKDYGVTTWEWSADVQSSQAQMNDLWSRNATLRILPVAPGKVICQAQICDTSFEYKNADPIELLKKKFGNSGEIAQQILSSSISTPLTVGRVQSPLKYQNKQPGNCLSLASAGFGPSGLKTVDALENAEFLSLLLSMDKLSLVEKEKCFCEFRNPRSREAFLASKMHIKKIAGMAYTEFQSNDMYAQILSDGSPVVRLWKQYNYGTNYEGLLKSFNEDVHLSTYKKASGFTP